MNLQKLYSDFSNPSAFGGINSFYESVKLKYPTVKKREVVNFLRQNDAYTIHFPKRKVKKFRRIFVKGLNYQYNLDLVDLQAYARENSGFRYILNIIGAYYCNYY